MFNSNSGRSRETNAPSLPPAPTQAPGKRGMFSVIGQDVTITGNIAATADLHVDGRIDGDVDCGNLVQGTDSRIVGNVRAESARLAGEIEGRVTVRQLAVERAARISGDVEYETIAIENGATIDGRLKHISAEAMRAAASQPAPAPVAAVVTPTLTAIPVGDSEAA